MIIMSLKNNEKEKVTTGLILKFLIKFNRLNQKTAATKLNVPEYRLSRYCLNKQEMSYNDLLTISNYFHISVDVLLGKDLYFNYLVNFENATRKDLSFDTKEFPTKILEEILKSKSIWSYKHHKNFLVDNVNVVDQEFTVKDSNLVFKFKDFNKKWTI